MQNRSVLPLSQWLSPAYRGVDGASVAVLRIAVGTFVLVEILRFFFHGWIHALYLEPQILFSYLGFGWIKPWPSVLMYLHFAGMGVLAILVILGVFYRIAVIGLFFGFLYVFMLDQANYLNQHYLLLSVLFLLCLMPADRVYVAGRLFRRNPGNDGSHQLIPAWNIWAIRFQFELFLLYAGLVKLNPDWMRGEPLGFWLSIRANDWPLLEPLMNHSATGVIFANAVILLHLLGAPMLLWRRTRLIVFLLYLAFHLANSVVFNIGIFPWLAVIGALMFFDPDWPRQVAARLSDTRVRNPEEIKPVVFPVQPLVSTVLLVFFAWQIVVPLRSLLYPGNVAWTNEGYRFSWRMKLDDRRNTAQFEIRDPLTGRRWIVDPAEHLTDRQLLQVPISPDMLLQYARFLASSWWVSEGVEGAEVRARVLYSLNGRPPRLFVDPELDLTTVPRSFAHQRWILQQRVLQE